MTQLPTFTVPRTQSTLDLPPAEREQAFSRIRDLLQQHNATIVAHYYTDPDIQRLADETNGFVGDSLAMAEYGLRHPAKTLIVAGVRFMGESAKILSPEKRVLMPTLKAECSLDLGCPVDAFSEFCDQHPDRTVVVYVNTSAAVKARADWTVTSSNAVKIIDHLDAQGEKILWAPDRYLGRYVQEQTGANMLLWDGACVVHEEFKAHSLQQLKTQYPEAAVLAHPESPKAVVDLADAVGSTSVLLKASQTLKNQTFIVATDCGIFYKMQQASPDKTFMEAPTAGIGATCRSCAHCPWMAMNTLDALEQSLKTGANEITVDDAIIKKARIPLQRMIDFS